MSFRKITVCSLLVLLCLLIMLPLDASAKGKRGKKSKKQTAPTGWEYIVSLQVPVVKVNYSVDGKSQDIDDAWAGIGLSVSGGYRWKYAGVYIDEFIGGAWWTGDGDADAAFIETTHLVLRGFYQLNNKIELNAGFGIGWMASAGDGGMIRDKNGDNSLAFSLKFLGSLSYHITRDVMFGVHLDYNLGFKNYKVSDFWTGESTKVKSYIHFIYPGLHLRGTFDMPLLW